MKIQDIQIDSKPIEVTFATVSVRGVSGYSSAINTSERNVTKRVKAIKESTIMQYNGQVETFRKFIELENGQIIRFFWCNGKPRTQFNNFRKAI